MKKIILDCDPGHDDAIAIMLAAYHPDIKLKGLTVVSGNQSLEKTGKNTLNLCDYFNLDVPVCLGATRPIIKEEQVCPDIHGETGLDGFDFPKHQRTYDSRRATDFIIESLMESQDKLTVVTTGPMTNLALAMRIEPKIIDKIEQVVLMGGSIANGNVSPAAEYNIYADPEAAHIVFNSGVKVLMVGLDVTRKLMVLPEIIKRMDNIKNRLSKLFVDLMNVFNDNQQRVFGLPGGPLHDPLTIAYLIDPTILTTRKTNCEIDITGGPSYGRTNVDFYDYLKQEKNIEVAIDVDVDKFWDLIESVLKMG